MAWDESPSCFGCGPTNPHGLNLQFSREGDRLFCAYVAKEEHEGYRGVLHGGITAAILDELMGALLQSEEIYAVTAELKVSYYIPVRTGERLECSAEITKTDRRKMYLRAIARLADGTIAAAAEAIYVIMAGDSC